MSQSTPTFETPNLPEEPEDFRDIPDFELNPAELAELEQLLEDHAADVEAVLEPTRERLRDRIARQIEREELVTPSKLSRKRSRFILFLVPLVGVLLISLLYVATFVSRFRIETKQKVNSTETELRALRVGIQKFRSLNNSVPNSGIRSLIESLRRPSTSHRDCLPLDKDVKVKRLKDNTLVDLWGRPYVYVHNQSGLALYSVGPNGRDEEGAGDDIKISLD